MTVLVGLGAIAAYLALCYGLGRIVQLVLPDDWTGSGNPPACIVGFFAQAALACIACLLVMLWCAMGEIGEGILAALPPAPPLPSWLGTAALVLGALLVHPAAHALYSWRERASARSIHAALHGDVDAAQPGRSDAFIAELVRLKGAR